MGLRPYDGVERRFRDDDPDPVAGRALVMRVLGLTALPAETRYALSFFSGGIGVVDRLAIAMPADDALVALVVKFIDGCFDGDDEDLRWLLDAEDGADAAAPARRFVEEHRRPFMPPCNATPIWFERGSNVNHWAVLWAHDGILGYLAYDQG